MDYSNCPAVHPLTRTERRCLELIAQGMDEKQIGAELVLAPSEVTTVLSVATIKMGAKNRMAAIARATRLGILKLDDSKRES